MKAKPVGKPVGKSPVGKTVEAKSVDKPVGKSPVCKTVEAKSKSASQFRKTGRVVTLGLCAEDREALTRCREFAELVPRLQDELHTTFETDTDDMRPNKQDMQSSTEAFAQKMREQHRLQQQELRIELEALQMQLEMCKVLQKIQAIGHILGPNKIPVWIDPGCGMDHSTSYNMTQCYSLRGLHGHHMYDAGVNMWLQYGEIEQLWELLGQAQVLARGIVDEYCLEWDAVVKGKLPQSFLILDDISLRSSLQIWSQMNYVYPLKGFWEFMLHTHICLYWHQRTKNERRDLLALAPECKSRPSWSPEQRGVRFHFDFSKSVCFHWDETEEHSYTGSVHIRQVQERLRIGEDLDCEIARFEDYVFVTSSKLSQINREFSSATLGIDWSDLGDANDLKFETRAPGDRAGIGFDADRASASSGSNKDFSKANRVSSGDVNVSFVPFLTLQCV